MWLKLLKLSLGQAVKVATVHELKLKGRRAEERRSCGWLYLCQQSDKVSLKRSAASQSSLTSKVWFLLALAKLQKQQSISVPQLD